jgi:hypothetical protein
LLDRIADELRIRTVLREVMALAEQASPLTDPQVQAQLIALANTARSACRRCRSTDEAPAAHRLSLTPGVQPVPDDPGTAR